MLRTIRYFLLSLLLLTALFATSAPAQDAGAAADETVVTNVAADAITKLDGARRQLADLRVAVEAAREDEPKLAELKVKVEALTRDIINASVGTRERFNQIKGRLDELGPAPADGAAPESAVVDAERQRLTAERAEINAVTGNAESLSIDATQLSDQITRIRRDLFTNTLFRRTEITPTMLSDAGDAFVSEGDTLRRAVGSWLRFVWAYKRSALYTAISISILLGLAFYAGGRRLFGPLIARHHATTERPTFTRRLTVAFFSTTVPTFALTVFVVATYGLFEGLNILRPDIAPIISITLSMLVSVVFVTSLSRAVLAPDRAQWRLVNVSDHGARLLGFAIFAMVIANALDYMFGGISEAMGSPIIVTVIKSLLAAVVIGLILIWMSRIKPMVEKGGDPHVAGRPWPRAFSVALLLTGLLLIGAALFGYVGLARFVATQIVITGAMLITMYIGILAGKAVSKPGAFVETSLGRHLAEHYKLSPIALDQVALVFGLGIYFFVLLFGLPIIFLLWGFQVGDIQAWAYRMFTEIRIGNFSISLVGIVAGILVFAFGLLLTRWFQRWVDGNVMERSHVDPGVRNSVRTAVGYAGVAIAGLIGISSAGIDLSSFALVAGALSLGIGFGLQNIVSNFVSGLILLAERPFKVGDWVVAGTTEGFVRRISVRATEIETFQRQSVIVPNSVLINGQVGNWTHRNKFGRVDLAISVHGGNDPRRVMEILADVARNHAMLLRNPEPLVVFLAFSPLTLDFEVRAFVADVLNGTTARTDLRASILERLRQEEIPLSGPAAAEVPVKISPEGAALLSSLLERAAAPFAAGTSGPSAETGMPPDRAAGS
ncbi:DUF3772 domain-containing protein [Rhizobium sp. TRM95111]|uniref:DUF3772 domain-containing protein n=1 Tax=Rhizobium alarense TaxID=2846851 RepID=UPI001F1EE6DE|nr:DUF3772 domain-containing protein [Rhizobium alarense]MCF3640512.1 DUF3772 domain-containing protein [Rhizobium alarense]